MNDVEPELDPAPKQEPEEDDESGKMSFLEHLDELRRRLLHIIIYVGVGFLARRTPGAPHTDGSIPVLRPHDAGDDLFRHVVPRRGVAEELQCGVQGRPSPDRQAEGDHHRRLAPFRVALCA